MSPDPNSVWLGVGESATSFNDPHYGNEWAYNVMFIKNVIGSVPASARRVAQKPVVTKEQII